MTRLLLLPGMDGTEAFFRPFVEHCPPGVDAQTLEYGSLHADSYQSLADQVATRLPTDDFFLLAWSFSGPLALMMSTRPGLRLRGIILVTSFAYKPVRFLPAWTAALAQPWLLALYPIGSMGQALLHGYSTPTLRALQREAFSKTTAASLAARVRLLLRVDARPALRECPVPILYVRAQDDRVIHRDHGQLVVREAPDASVVDVPGPHLCLATHPREAWAAMAPFMNAPVGQGST